VYLYRWRLGWLLGRRFLLLIHVGQRTGRQHDGVGDRRISATGSRGRRHQRVRAYRGLAAQHPGVAESGNRYRISRFRAADRILGGDEAIAVLASYERRHRIGGPIIRRVLSRLVGWHYSGSPEDRRRIAEVYRVSPGVHARSRPVSLGGYPGGGRVRYCCSRVERNPGRPCAA
jgi:hypothetical protein